MSPYQRALALGQIELFESGPSGVVVPDSWDPCDFELERQAGFLADRRAVGRLSALRVRVGVCKCGGRCGSCPSTEGGT